MNHLTDQENIQQLNLATIQVDEIEEMDTQEGNILSTNLVINLAVNFNTSNSCIIKYLIVNCSWNSFCFMKIFDYL